MFRQEAITRRQRQGKLRAACNRAVTERLNKLKHVSRIKR